MPLTFNDRLRKKEILLLLITVALVDFASSYGTREEICYGGTYDVPLYYTPPVFEGDIYFKPRGKQKTLAVRDGTSLHKRFSVRTGSIKIKDLTEQDDGALVYFGQRQNVELDIKDCQDSQISSYGDLFSWRILSIGQYIEFSQVTSSGSALEPVVIWNRTDPSANTRGTVKRNYFEIPSLKPKDSGYYRCFGHVGELIKWKRLEVNEHFNNYYAEVGNNVEVQFPVKFPDLSHILFTSQQTGYEETYEAKYMSPRMTLTQSYFICRHVKEEDAGTYQFIDNEGFRAYQLELEVESRELPGWVYFVGLAVIILFLICCCCCVKKCCCKKSSNKRGRTETDAPQVFYHDTPQRTQPEVPLLSREPRVIHTDPPTYNSAAGNVELPPPTQITVPAGLERTSTPMYPTTSDSDPRFEFKGGVFPSAPPLDSGTDIQSVYTSDKLNFL